jgi:hypothetical protein
MPGKMTTNLQCKKYLAPNQRDFVCVPCSMTLILRDSNAECRVSTRNLNLIKRKSDVSGPWGSASEKATDWTAA